MINQENKKLLIAFAAFAILCVVMIIIAIVSNIPTTRKTITIDNFYNYVQNVPEDEKNAIEEALYHVSSLNTEDIPKNTTAVIRSDTYNQTFENNIYKTSFTVDIESLKQSYSVENLYSKLPVEESGLTDYTVLVLCLPLEDLIYDDFNCKDRLSQESGFTKSDPILKELPYSTLNYDISAEEDEDENLIILVKILLSEADYKSDVSFIIDSRQGEVEDWFESLGLDPENYNIRYVY
jgi:hypothetical protein